MKKKVIITVIIMITLIILTLWYNGILIFNYPDKKEDKIKGIDVSAYQGDIDWNILSKQGIDFVFIKATEGSSYVDEMFKRNYENALKTDLKIGAYHFFSYDSNGEKQADNFIRNVPKVEKMLPPVVDIEFYGNKYKNVPDIKKTQKQLQIMLEKLEEYYEKKPIIYATYKSYNLYIANNFEGNFIWIRDVYFRPNLIDNRDWTFWQYSNKVRLNGYSGQEKRIDMNVFNGDKEKFEKMFNYSPRDAVASTGSTLVELFGLCRELNAQAEGVEVGPAPVAEETNPEMAVPIEDLNLTQRSYNCLKREGIHTIGELVSHTEQDLLDIRNFGMKSIDEVKEKLQTLGLSLKSSPMAFDTNNLEGGTFFSPEDE